MSERATFEPVRMIEIELSAVLPTISAFDQQTKQHYRSARVLVRLHTQPLGFIDLRLTGAELPAEGYVDQIWQTLHQAINDHLRQDKLPELSMLDVAGIQYSDMPTCLQRRAWFLADAPLASVIVCTRDRTEYLANGLRSLLALEYPCYEIIVVDNAPKTNATANLIAQHYHRVSQIRYVREARPGLSWARNRGLQVARGEVVAFIDDDEIPSSHWLTELVSGFEISPEVACVTGTILPAEIETQPQDWFEQFGGHSKGRNFDRVIFNLTTDLTQNPFFPVPPFGAGGNMAFKTTVLRALGGFDNALGAGTPALATEDTAAFFDILTHGYTLVFDPAATVRHFHYRDLAHLRRQLYAYGVGLTAFFTRSVLNKPQSIFDLLGIIPKALQYFFSPRSLRNAKMRADYPSELTRRQLIGMMYGPIAYLRSRWHLRQVAKKFGPFEQAVTENAASRNIGQEKLVKVVGTH